MLDLQKLTSRMFCFVLFFLKSNTELGYNSSNYLKCLFSCCLVCVPSPGHLPCLEDSFWVRLVKSRVSRSTPLRHFQLEPSYQRSHLWVAGLAPDIRWSEQSWLNIKQRCLCISIATISTFLPSVLKLNAPPPLDFPKIETV